MAKIAVVTDSTCDVAPRVAEALGAIVVPVKVVFGDEEFRDGIDITPAEFFVKLRETDELPTTSQPSAGDFAQVYRELSHTADAILSVHVSGELSGTLASAHAAKEQLDLPIPIHIVDSRSASMGLGLMVMAAAKLARNGAEVARIEDRLQAMVARMNIFFVVDTLEYLHKGGRIGGAQRLLGSVLNLKPILHLDDGRIDALEKARTKPRAVQRLLELVESRVGDRQVHVAVLHAAAEEEALLLKEDIEARFSCAEMHLSELCPALGVHVGPGTVGVAFYTDDA
jgi:DegV family protein with EDD domain